MKNKKNIIIICLVVAIFFGGGYVIGSTTKNNKKEGLTRISSSSSSKVAVSSTIETSDFQSSTTSSSFEDVEEQIEASSSEKEVEKSRELPEQLMSYTDDQIEYARIWLDTIGDTTEDSNDFNLNISKIEKGTPVSPYGTGSIDWPFDVIVLTGNYSYQGMICYTSNRDGTVNKYDVPSHWHQDPEDLNNPEFMKNLTENIVENYSLISVPTGSPDLVERIIKLEKVTN